MPRPVKLVGLDFGTTTSSAVVASAEVLHSAATGRMELAQVREHYRSLMVFTPLLPNDRLDEQQVESLLDGWLAAGEVNAAEVFGGGALLTGLTAQRENAAALVRLVRGRLRDAVIASANDPCLESWLAFLGSCAALSRAHPDKTILNLDIGGGTTNLALGRAGEVLRSGCLFVGARHVRVEPGGYRIVRLSRYAEALFDDLGIRKGPRDCLSEMEIEAILDFYLRLLEGAVRGTPAQFQDTVARLHEQVTFRRPADVQDVCVTLSGGVGQLVYDHLHGHPWPGTSLYGDLGIDLARRIVAASTWAKDLRTYRPASAGRATVYGLLRYSTEVSGTTLFLPRPGLLPLADMPILARLGGGTTDGQVRDALDLVRRSSCGGCVQVRVGGVEATAVAGLGQIIARMLRETSFPVDHPLVLLVQENVGKVLGHYVTEWGRLPVALVVIDEIAPRDAQYVHIGRPQDQAVPVSFFGLHPTADSDTTETGHP
jgi:ethanolamine utilization protein EutA